MFGPVDCKLVLHPVSETRHLLGVRVAKGCASVVGVKYRAALYGPFPSAVDEYHLRRACPSLGIVLVVAYGLDLAGYLKASIVIHGQREASHQIGGAVLEIVGRDGIVGKSVERYGHSGPLISVAVVAMVAVYDL